MFLQIVVSPYALLAEKVNAPVPALVKDPNPEIIPETVSLPESPDVRVIPSANSTSRSAQRLDCIGSINIISS